MHTISDEQWRRAIDGCTQYPIAFMVSGGQALISMDVGSFVIYPPAGWVRLTPTEWDPSTGDPDPDPPTLESP